MRVAKFAHSHSGSQFLRHLPLHWNSIMLPPHFGQIRLRIDEMRLEFDSPESLSKIRIVVSDTFQVGWRDDCAASIRQLQTEDQFPGRELPQKRQRLQDIQVGTAGIVGKHLACDGEFPVIATVISWSL